MGEVIEFPLYEQGSREYWRAVFWAAFERLDYALARMQELDEEGEA